MKSKTVSNHFLCILSPILLFAVLGMLSGCPLSSNAGSNLNILNTSLAAGEVGTGYAATFQATGGMPPYTWALASGTLPFGVVLSAGGVLSGTLSNGGTSTFMIKVTDSASASVEKQFSILVSGLSITTSSLLNGQVGVAYNQSLNATSGVPPYSWSLAGGAMPGGLSISPSGAVSGTPGAAGTFSFTAHVVDSASSSASAQLSLTVIGAVLTITTATLPDGQTGSAYTSSMSAAGGTPPYTWSLAGGALPPGMMLAPGGTVSGTAANGGSYTFMVQVMDSASASSSKQFSINVTGLSITTTSPLADGKVGSAYSQVMSATGGIAPYSWSISGGTIPPRLSLLGSGVLSGSPSTSGIYSFTVQATDSAASTASKNFSLTVAP
ncbi:MAG: Ig domain-containing protein [Spirochaetia bacterium]|jgi:hypothetical protein